MEFKLVDTTLRDGEQTAVRSISPSLYLFVFLSLPHSFSLRLDSARHQDRIGCAVRGTLSRHWL